MNPIYFLSLLSLVLCSCSKPKQDEFFFPQPDGKRLEVTARTIRAGAGVETGRIIQRVDGEETINGKTYQKYVTVYEALPGVKPWISYVRYAPDGGYRLEGKHKDKPEFLDAPLPLVIGRSWVVDSPEAKKEVRAESIEPLELPDRRYDRCLRLSYRSLDPSQSFEGTIFIAAGVGLVKEIRREPNFTSESVVNYK